jgi:hypothetical protein
MGLARPDSTLLTLCSARRSFALLPKQISEPSLVDISQTSA